MYIKQASYDDLETILMLQKQCFFPQAELYNMYDIAPMKQTLDEVKSDYSSHIFLKMVEDSKIIGSVRACRNGNIIYVSRLIIDPDYQNLGFGQKLMNCIEEYYPDAAGFELMTGHRSYKNIYLYRKLGYEIYDEETVNDNMTILYMKKEAHSYAFI
jgi:ribosomal protein S18 acetylase RimI-like enzyme